MLLTRRPLIEADSLQDAVNVLRPGFDPKPLLNKLAGGPDSSASTSPKVVSEKALALLKGLLEPQPVLRIGAADAVDLCKEWAAEARRGATGPLRPTTDTGQCLLAPAPERQSSQDM